MPEHHHHHTLCGCGHDHDHHHEDGCGCGHDHDHHHEDGCGCGHGHGHHHEESCSCGHHHHHDHHVHHTPRGKQTVYLLENLGCANCAAKMEAKIAALPGVSGATITFATKQLRLTAEDPDSLLPQIRKICTSIESEVRVVPRETHHSHGHHDRRELYEILAGIALFGFGLVLPKGSLVVFVIAYLILGGSILREAFRNLRKGHVFDENFLMSIATLGAFAIGEYPEAVGVMLFYRIGEYFEHKAVERNRSQIMAAIDMRPETVNLLEGDSVRVIPAEEARVGDLLLIRPGDRIPLDGVVTEGESRIDTAPITGEPVPVSAKPGDSLVSGCVNQSGLLKLRVKKPLSESMVTRILDAVENAAAGKPKLDRFITRFAKIYTPAVIAAAALTAIVPSLITGQWHYWIYTALSFLVMSCPCALVLSVPLAFFSGIGLGSKQGILFKGGASLEAMAQLKAVVMDKTGTLTRGDFRLQQILSLGELEEDKLLSLCAACERNSTHPIAVSILSAARERGLDCPTPEAMEEIPGHGVAAQLAEGRVLCGNRKLMEKYGVDIPELTETSYGAEVFLALDERLEGLFRISDTVKPDAEAAVSRLKAMGLHTAMLTGDSESGAKAVAGELGIGEVHVGLLPQQKLEHLGKIRENRGAVMFVGDGINDAPVLAGADVSAAMGSGADAAIEAADAVFMTTAVSSVPEAIGIARATRRIAIQNVVFALAVKLVVMILGLLGHASMWMAVFADSGVAMLCVLNSVRVLYRKAKR